MRTNATQSRTEQFNNYISQYKDQVKNDVSEEYYHVDVVAEAYSQGFSDGKKSGKKDFIDQILKNKVEVFTRKANQAYILSHDLISYLTKLGYSIESLHISLTSSCPKVIISVTEDLMVNDDFVEKAYPKIFENKNIFSQLFPDSLDMGLVSSNNLDLELLEEDGFGYTETFNS